MSVRRPMVWIVMASIAGCIAAFCLPLAVTVGGLFLSLGTVLAFNHKEIFEGACLRQIAVACLLLLFFAAGFCRLWSMEGFFQRLQLYDGKNVQIRGMVTQSQIREKSVKLVVRSAELGTGVMVQFWTEQPEDFSRAEGRMLHASGELQSPLGAANPGGFDYGRYLKGKNVGLLFSCDAADVKLVKSSHSITASLLAWLSDFRAERRSRLLQLLGAEEGSLMIGMLLGDKSLMEEDVYEGFQKNGIAHILCVSGIHISIVCSCLETLLRRGKKVVRSGAMLVGLFFYAALASFAPSVMRAVFMVAFSVVARLLHQRHDRLSALCASCLLMIFYNPYLIFQAGFQLSYLAVASLTVVLPWLEAMTEQMVRITGKERIRSISAVISPMIALQVIMAPVTAYLFQYFSISAFFLNGPIILAAGIVIPVGMLLMTAPSWCFTGLPGILLHGVSFLAKVLVYFMEFLSETTAKWEGSSFCTVSPTLGALLMFYGLTAFICWEERHLWARMRRKRGSAMVLVAIIFVVNIGPWAAGIAPHPFFWSREHYDLVFVDVGQGDCLHIRTPSGKNVLIDGGGSKNYEVGKKILLPYLLKNGVDSIDLAVVTHLHDDHFSGIRELAQNIKIQQLALHDMNRYRKSVWELGGKGETKPLYIGAGDRIVLDKDVWIDVLWPVKGEKADYEECLQEGYDENNNSLLLQISYRGTKILVTGDMGKEQEEEVLGRCSPEELHTHILKVGHHGSPYSTGQSFAAAVKPEAAVIQVGKNNFGHPSPAVIELLRNYDIMVFRNDLQGAVMLKEVRDGKASFLTMQKTQTLF